MKQGNGVVPKYDGDYEASLESLINFVGRFFKLMNGKQWGYLHKKGLGDQLMRSLSSIPSNLEEGRGRGYGGASSEEIPYLKYALGVGARGDGSNKDCEGSRANKK